MRSSRTLLVLLLLSGTIVLVWWNRSSSTAPPEAQILLSSGWADEQSCADCHEQAETFWETGHANTLLPATHPDSLRQLLRLNDDRSLVSETGIQVEQRGDTVAAVFRQADQQRRLPLDWCFGSGAHARTWVGTLSDSWGGTDLVEFRWTWYHEHDRFDLTPGQEPNPSETYFGPLGLLFDHPKTRRCFACHSTRMQIHEGQLVESQIHAGVTCQRCHGPRESHVKSEGEIHESFWQTASALEAINRCGQCHRRADEQPPEEIRPDNPEIVRFQPVGLIQSPCFLNSERLTCTTCHDPHRTMKSQDSQGIWQCIQCHDPMQTAHTLCGAGRRDDCLRCHMPKVQGEAPVSFTDHWIRVREPVAIEP